MASALVADGHRARRADDDSLGPSRDHVHPVDV